MDRGKVTFWMDGYMRSSVRITTAEGQELPPVFSFSAEFLARQLVNELPFWEEVEPECWIIKQGEST